MAQVIGTVEKLAGTAFARAADGTQRELRIGDELYVGELLITGSGAVIEVVVPGSPSIVLPGERELRLTDELLAETRDSADEAAVQDPTIAAVVSALEGDGDILENLQATAAGGPQSDEGSSFVRLGRIAFDLPEFASLRDGVIGETPTFIEGEGDNDLQLLLGDEPGVDPGDGGSAPGTDPDNPPPSPPVVNEAPVATDDSFAGDFATALQGNVLTNDTDPENDSLTVTDNTTPANGTLSLNPDGTFTYTPNDGFSGEDSFTYTVSDGNGNSDTATVTITVGGEPVTPPAPPPPGANEAPVAVDDSVETGFESAVTVPVLGNDSDPDGDLLQITANTEPSNGAVTVNPDGTITYTPDAGFSGSDSFDYTVSDGQGNESTATVTVTVAAEPTEPGLPTATITLDPNITADDVISAAEQNQQIAITGSTGADVAAGDIVTLTVNGDTYTGPVDASGNFSIDVPGSDLVADGDLTVDASVTTSTGNPNGEAMATDTEGYSVNTDSPLASITLDANITADDVIDAAEQNQQIAITGTTGGDVAAGDIVTLTVNGNTYTGPVDASGNFSIDVPGSDLVADGDLTIDASVTTSTGDPNGEATATDTEGYSVNIGAPSASITLDANITPDDIIDATEAGQNIAITGSTGGDVAAGDTVTVTVNGNAYTGQVDASGNFSIDVPGSDLVADGDLTVDASVTTSTGSPNGEATATDTEGYSVNAGSPSATITLDANITPDDIIDATEAGQNIAITGSTGGDVAPGDTVTLTVNGNDYTGQVDASGGFSIEVPGSDLVADGDLTVDASVTTSTGSPNGEATATDTEGYSVSTGSPSATITLDANITADDVIDAAEQNQQIAITGSTGGEVAAGDIVTLTVNGNTYTGPVDASGNFSIDVPGSDLVADGDLTIDASVTTSTGNPNGEATATATEGYSVNTTSPSASISLNANITADDVIDATEAGQNIAIIGSTGGDVAEGDTVTLTVNGNDYTGQVDASGNFSIEVPGADLVSDGDLTIDASVTTSTGSPNGEATATDTEDYSVNTTSPSATITLDANITADDVISAAEASQQIAITGSTGGDVAENDTVTLTVNGNDYTGQVDASGNFSIDVPGSDLVADGDLTVDARVTTSTGNPNGEATATDTEGYAVNTGSPSATISLDANITPDDIIDATEAGQNIAITGSTGGDVAAGDTVTVTVNGNAYTGQVDASGKFSIDVPGADLVADGDLTVDASVTTSTGNPNGEAMATDTEGYSVNTGSPSASITLDANITADDVIDATESGENVAITGSTGGDVAPGDTVTLTVNGNTYTGPVDASGNFSIDVPGTELVADGDKIIDASVTTSTGSPNGEATATDTEGYSVNTGSPSASISLDASITPDDVIDAAEQNQQIAIIGSTGGDVAPGDTVTLTVNGSDYTGQVDASGNFSIDVPGADLVSDGDLTIDASVTTSTGSPNGEATATDTEGYSVNTTSPSATITLDSNITPDDVIDAAEQNQQIAITGSTGGDVAENDTVTLTVNGNTYTGPVDASGNFSIDVPGSDLVADSDLTIDASVTTSTGNPNGEATATATEGYSVDTANTPPQADPVLTIAEFASGPGPSGTLSNPQLAVQFSVDGVLDGNGAESIPTLGGLDSETDLEGLTFTLRSLPTNGTLYLDADGDGTYARAQVGDDFSSVSGLYWGTTATQITQDLSTDATGVSVSGFNNGEASIRQTGSGLGVVSSESIQSQVPEQLGNRNGTSESMTLNFGGPVTEATVRIERLIVNEGEAGRVEALDADGNAIGSWTFFGAANRTLGGQPIDFNIGGNGGSFTISDTSEPFYALRFTATPYVDGVTQGPGNADSSDYFIKSVAYTRISLEGAEFTYDVTDTDGNISDPATVVIEPPVVDPVALDLDNDGVEYLSREAGVVFTDEETGESSNTAWVAGDDGLLVIDADNSGTVNTTREYVFTEWSETAETDMEAVREVFDSNGNDMLDAGDEAWDQFAVWQDADSDGVTDQGEMRSLTELGVESIALTYGDGSTPGTAADGDVMIYGQSEVTWTDGEVTVAEDTGFAIDAADVLTGGDDLVLPAGDEGAVEAGKSSLDSQPLAAQTSDNIAAELAALEVDLLLNTGNDDKLNEGGAAE